MKIKPNIFPGILFFLCFSTSCVAIYVSSSFLECTLDIKNILLFSVVNILLKKKDNCFHCMLPLKLSESSVILNRKLNNMEISDSYVKGGITCHNMQRHWDDRNDIEQGYTDFF